MKSIRRDVDELFSILPFEVDFFEKKHGYPIHYVGNPTVDEVAAYQKAHPQPVRGGEKVSGGEKPFIALLAGSRSHEIRDNLPRMIEAARPFMESYRLIIAGAPNIESSYYQQYVGDADVEIVYGKTYDLLASATAALVTSGTATLETALFRVPQVVCYFMQARILATWARKVILKTPFVSLVNLVAGREVVPELVADQMTVERCHRHLAAILPGGSAREAQLQGYEEMAARLGEPGAPQRAARIMVQKLRKDD